MFDGSPYLTLDESMLSYFSIPHFKKEFLVSYAIVIVPSSDIHREPQAITVLNINPKYIRSQTTNVKKIELKQKDRSNLADAIVGKILDHPLSSDVQLWACRFFSCSGPQYRGEKNQKQNLLYELEQDFEVQYPPKRRVQDPSYGCIQFHYCPVLYAHQTAAAYTEDTKPKLEQLLKEFDGLDSRAAVAERINRLNGQPLNNGIMGTIYISPLLVQEMEFIVQKKG